MLLAYNLFEYNAVFCWLAKFNTEWVLIIGFVFMYKNKAVLKLKMIYQQVNYLIDIDKVVFHLRGDFSGKLCSLPVESR
jgi:hypothetical protein